MQIKIQYFLGVHNRLVPSFVALAALIETQATEAHGHGWQWENKMETSNDAYYSTTLHSMRTAFTVLPVRHRVEKKKHNFSRKAVRLVRKKKTWARIVSNACRPRSNSRHRSSIFRCKEMNKMWVFLEIFFTYCLPERILWYNFPRMGEIIVVPHSKTYYVKRDRN